MKLVLGPAALVLFGVMAMPQGLLGATPSEAALGFLKTRMGPIGLLDSFVEDRTDYSYTYDNALAAMAFLSAGDRLSAQRVLDGVRWDWPCCGWRISASLPYDWGRGGGHFGRRTQCLSASGAQSVLLANR